jgi:hypothetical protein
VPEVQWRHLMTEEEFEADVQSLMNSLHFTREVAVTVVRQVRYANDNGNCCPF